MTNIFHIALGPRPAQGFEDQDVKSHDASDGFKTGAFQRTDLQIEYVITGEVYDVYTVDLAHPQSQNIISYLTRELPKKFQRSWPEDYRDNPNYAGLINLHTEVQTPESFDITFPTTQEVKALLLEIFTNPEDPDSDPIQVLGKYNSDTIPLYKVRIRFGDEKTLSPFDRDALQKFLGGFKDKSAEEIAKEYGADVLNLYFFAKENAAPPNKEVEAPTPAATSWVTPTLTFLGEKTVLGGTTDNDLSEIPALWFHSIARKTRIREILGERDYVWLLNNSGDKKDYVPYIQLARFAEADGYQKGWLYRSFSKLSESDKQEMRDLLDDIRAQTYYASFEYTKNGIVYQTSLYLDPISDFCEFQISSGGENFQLHGFDDDGDGAWIFKTSSEDSFPIAKEILEMIRTWWQEQKTADAEEDNEIVRKQFAIFETGLLARFQDNPPEGMAP